MEGATPSNGQSSTITSLHINGNTMQRHASIELEGKRLLRSVAYNGRRRDENIDWSAELEGVVVIEHMESGSTTSGEARLEPQDAGQQLPRIEQRDTDGGMELDLVLPLTAFVDNEHLEDNSYGSASEVLMGMKENPLSNEPIKWDHDSTLDELTEQLNTSIRVDLGQIATPDQIDGESSVLLKVSYTDLSDEELGQSLHDRPLFRNKE